MKLASWQRGDVAEYGRVDEAGPVAASDELRRRYPSLKALLSAGALRELADDRSGREPRTADELRWRPPIPGPDKIFCVGMNYAAHIREMGREPPRYPALFGRFPHSFVGHGDNLIRPRVSHKYDFEGELAVVIGKPARHVDRDSALDFVAGYTCLMEGTLRDYQDHTTQFTAGKNFQHSGAIGPWIVTADEIPDPKVLKLETRVNGEVMQRGELADLCVDIPAMIEYLSGICELRPGDIIATGTPSGVGAARRPPVWLKPGDTVEVDISEIGVLANLVVDET